MGNNRAKEANRALKRPRTHLMTNSGTATNRTVVVGSRTCDIEEMLTESTVIVRRTRSLRPILAYWRPCFKNQKTKIIYEMLKEKNNFKC